LKLPSLLLFTDTHFNNLYGSRVTGHGSRVTGHEKKTSIPKGTEVFEIL